MAGRIGAFGKIPSLGDFFRFDLPQRFTAPWDAWLQEVLGACMEQVDDWDSLYLSAPIWRFSLSAGLAGEEQVAGIIMASVDRVGRRFPLTLAQVDLEGPLGAVHFANAAQFVELEEVALAALSEELTQDELKARLGGVSLKNAAHCMSRVEPGQFVGSCETDLSAALAGEQATRNLHRPSLWSSVSGGVQRCLACDGLPDATQLHALFDITAPLWMSEPQEEYV